MATESSEYISPASSSSSKPQQQNPNPINYIRSFITLVSNSCLRVLGHLNPKDKSKRLLNVIWYGTEDTKNNGFQVPPSNAVNSFVTFCTSQIKNVLVKPLTSLASYGYHFGSLAIRAAINSILSRPTKPRRKFTTVAPLPYIFNEELNKTEATTDSDASSVKGSVNDGLQTSWNLLVQPQYPGYSYYEHWLNHAYQSMPCEALYQDPTNAASSLIASEPVFAPQSLFSTFPPAPISLPPVDREVDFETKNFNFKQYELWGPKGDNIQRDQTAYTVDGSSYQDELWGFQGNDNLEDQTAYTVDGSFYQNETWGSQENDNHKDSNHYDLWLNHAYQSMPCEALYQDPTNAASSLIASEAVFAPQSLFTTFPPVPFSRPPVDGGFDFETKNFKQYELWGPQGDNNQGDHTAYTVDGSFHQNETWGAQGNDNQEDQSAYRSFYQNETWGSLGNENHVDQTAYTIDRSSYMISRKPFDPIRRPCNPFGPIEPFSYLP